MMQPTLKSKKESDSIRFQARPMRFATLSLIALPITLALALGLGFGSQEARAQASQEPDLPLVSGPMEWVQVSADSTGFVLADSNREFVPWGFNYDHDPAGRLLEDYWFSEPDLVKTHLRRIRATGATVVRIHLQTGKFLEAKDQINPASIDRLKELVDDCESIGLRIDLTGLGCYHLADVPPWFDALSEEERWEAQAFFWREVARSVAASPAIFCFDLMNEPVVSGGKRESGEWLGPGFAGKHFVQFISLDPAGRGRPEVAAAWISQMVDAIREVDQRHLITVGMVDWSLERPGLTSGFVPSKVSERLDFLCVHLYPEKDQVSEALQTLQGFAIGKPLVIEEFFPLKCSFDEAAEFVEGSRQHAAGWISFHWGESDERLREVGDIRSAIELQWRERFVGLMQK